MVDFKWELQGTVDTEIGETDILQFAGEGGFNAPVFVSEYQETMHVKSSLGADLSDGNDPNNNKFISQDGGTAGKSQADWGDGTEDLDAITDAEACLKITVSDSVNIVVTEIAFYSYERGGDPEDPAPGISVKACEVGDTNFVSAEGEASALELTDSDTPATSHEFFIVISKSPTSKGVNPDTLRFEAVVQ